MKPLAATLLCLLLTSLIGCAARPPLDIAPRRAILAADELIIPTRTCGNLFFAEVELNGRGPYWMLVDNGAAVTILSPRAAQELGDIRPLDIKLIGADGEAASSLGLVRIDRLTTGGLELRGFDAIVMDMEPFELGIRERLDGILGYWSFTHLLITFDYAASKLRVSRGRLRNADDVYRLARDSAPVLDIDIGGRRETMLLDTGSAAGFTVRAAHDWLFLHPPSPVGTVIVAAGMRERQAARLGHDATFAGIAFPQPTVDLTNLSTGIIGAAILRNFSVTFDPARRRVRLIPAAITPVHLAGVRGIGARLDPARDRLLVRDVYPDGPAAQAGLQIGDEITAVNGEPIASLPCDAMRRLMRESHLALTIDRADRPETLNIAIVDIIP